MPTFILNNKGRRIQNYFARGKDCTHTSPDRFVVKSSQMCPTKLIFMLFSTNPGFETIETQLPPHTP